MSFKYNYFSLSEIEALICCLVFAYVKLCFLTTGFVINFSVIMDNRWSFYKSPFEVTFPYNIITQQENRSDDKTNTKIDTPYSLYLADIQ